MWIHFVCCTQALDLIVTLEDHDHLSWSTHAKNITIANKASKMLNFIKRYLSKRSEDTKATAYLDQ